jgi:hypothetical protein
MIVQLFGGFTSDIANFARALSKSCQTTFAPVDPGILTAKSAKNAKKKVKA